MTPQLSFPAVSLAIGLSLVLAACAAKTDQPGECLSSKTRVEATLDYVVDGDTLVLTDKRTVRVLGINAPESHPSPQPQALAATQKAKELLPKKTKLWLYLGAQAEDHHGRTLAHVVTTNGVNLAEQLLSNGLAASTAVQPNIRCANHYSELEQQARKKKLGVWKNTHPWQLIDKRINENHIGFRLVTSSVKRISAGKEYYQLYLANGLRVSVKKTLAKQINASKLEGKRLTVRGWIQWRNNKASLGLHHSSNLQIQGD